MIKKALFTTLILLIAHFTLVEMFAPTYQTGQHLWQDNVIKAQNYLYETPEPQGVVIGSSLSARLDEELLPAGFHNLALGGLGVHDGLKVIRAHGKLPNIVCAELNLVTRPPSKDFDNTVFSPVMNPVRRLIPSFREKHQPIGIIGNGIMNLKGGKQDKKADAPLGPTDAERGKSDAAFQAILDKAVKNNQEAWDQALLDEWIAKLKADVSWLQEQGVEVVFFEMPISELSCDLPKLGSVRTAMEEAFSGSGVRFLPRPDCGQYRTTDGAHLNPASANAFSRWLTSHLQQDAAQ
ncbi:MAG: hypothetical protein AAF206_07435 [Bacteroidota bacterium]